VFRLFYFPYQFYFSNCYRLHTLQIVVVLMIFNIVEYKYVGLHCELNISLFGNRQRYFLRETIYLLHDHII